MPTDMKSLSLACRVVIDMHALNNEGSESNRLITRQVSIVTPSVSDDGQAGYRRAVVNAISGDMNKHIFADAFRNIALDLKLPMNEASQALDPARIMGDPEFAKFIGQKDKSVAEIINQLLTCSLTDICGIMITASGQSIKRKSAIEFGWTIGLPEITEVQEFIHARHAITRVHRTRASKDDPEARKAVEKESQANLGQMIFNRPASSGVYAFVAHFDLAAIGFNDVTQLYPESIEHFKTQNPIPIDRKLRMQASLLALAQTLLHPKGALTSTQLPHVLDVNGFVSISSSAAAAPLLSPLTDNFVERAHDLTNLLNQLHGKEAVSIKPFSGGEGLLQVIAELVENYKPGRYTRYE